MAGLTTGNQKGFSGYELGTLQVVRRSLFGRLVFHPCPSCGSQNNTQLEKIVGSCLILIDKSTSYIGQIRLRTVWTVGVANVCWWQQPLLLLKSQIWPNDLHVVSTREIRYHLDKILQKCHQKVHPLPQCTVGSVLNCVFC